MKRIAELVLCLSLFASSAFAGGGFGERIFFQVGGTIGADVMNYGGTFLKDNPASNLDPLEFSSLNVNYATIVLAGRLNFLEMSNNSSLALAFRPCASFGRAYNDAGGGNSTTLRLPVTIDYNSGASSTVSTRAKTGFSFGVGAEFLMYPLGNAVDVVEQGVNGSGNVSSQALNFKANWIQPVVVVGIKFFGKHYYCRELNFKASYTSLSSISNKTNDGSGLYEKVSDFTSVGLMVSFLQYLNY